MNLTLEQKLEILKDVQEEIDEKAKRSHYASFICTHLSNHVDNKYNRDLSIAEILKLFKEVSKQKPLIIHRGEPWFETDFEGYLKRTKVLNKAIRKVKRKIWWRDFLHKIISYEF